MFSPARPDPGRRTDVCLGETSWIGATAQRVLDEDPELFFPIGNTGPALLQIEEAKGVCRRCPVVDTCLKWAIETGQDAGVWGGLSEDERRALKRHPRASAARADHSISERRRGGGPSSGDARTTSVGRDRRGGG